jgi:hypothetical protein
VLRTGLSGQIRITDPRGALKVCFSAFAKRVAYEGGFPVKGLKHETGFPAKELKIAMTY